MNLRQVRDEISAQIKKLENVLTALDGIGTGPRRGVHKAAGGKRPRMSAASRRKIAAAQKARWAKWRANKKKAA